jgi:hypothetical protein
MEIRNITTRDIAIQGIAIPDIEVITNRTGEAIAIPRAAPVVVNIGSPIVNIPGCVEAHESNNKSNKVGIDDPKGMVTYCDAGVPSFNPIQFEPEQIVPTYPAGVDTKREEKPKPPGQVDIPKAAAPATAKVECPTPGQQAKEPVGTFVEGFRKKVVEYKLIGNECIQVTEKVPLPQQIIAGLPSGGQVMQVGGIAVIATTSALLAKPLADLLLKSVKPTVKKVVKKVAALRGKTLPIQSAGERRSEQRQMNHAVKALRSVFPRKKG